MRQGWHKIDDGWRHDSGWEVALLPITKVYMLRSDKGKYLTDFHWDDEAEAIRGASNLIHFLDDMTKLIDSDD